MKRFIFLSILTISAMLSLSCEKEIDFTGQTPPGQIYANCLFNPDSIFRVYVSYSLPLTAPASEIDNRIEDAKLALVRINDASGNIIDTLKLVEHYKEVSIQFLVFESLKNLRPQAGTEYQLHVSEPLFDNRKEILANNTVPEEMPGFVHAIPHNPFVNPTQNDETFVFDVEWDDPNPNASNFFILETVFRNTDHNLNETQDLRSEFYSIGGQSDNQNIGKETDKFLYIFVNDDKIPALTNPPTISTTIAVLTSNWKNWIGQNQPGYSCDLAIRVRHVNYDTYRYYKEVEAYRLSTGSDIFAQPVEVHSNVNKGIGFLGGETLKEFVYQIQ